MARSRLCDSMQLIADVAGSIVERQKRHLNCDPPFPESRFGLPGHPIEGFAEAHLTDCNKLSAALVEYTKSKGQSKDISWLVSAFHELLLQYEWHMLLEARTRELCDSLDFDGVTFDELIATGDSLEASISSSNGEERIAACEQLDEFFDNQCRRLAFEVARHSTGDYLSGYAESVMRFPDPESIPMVASSIVTSLELAIEEVMKPNVTPNSLPDTSGSTRVAEKSNGESEPRQLFSRALETGRESDKELAKFINKQIRSSNEPINKTEEAVQFFKEYPEYLPRGFSEISAANSALDRLRKTEKYVPKQR